MKLAIVGSRKFEDYDLLLKYLKDTSGITAVVSGGARGADTLAERYADEHGLEKIIFPITSEDWKKHGYAAGPIRNKQIVEACDAMIAFWDGESTGTKDSIKQCQKAGKPVKVILYSSQTLDDFFG